MSFDVDINECLKVLKTGGIILYPTDTIWGLGCDATDAAAVAKIYALKNRAENKSMIVLLTSENEIEKYCKAPSEKIKTLLLKENRPLTIIYPEARELAKNLIGNDGTIAVRIVKDLFCEALINNLGKPIVSTSANISGESSPSCFAEISMEIISGADYVVSIKRSDTENKTASKIILWNNDDDIVVIRE